MSNEEETVWTAKEGRVTQNPPSLLESTPMERLGVSWNPPPTGAPGILPRRDELTPEQLQARAIERVKQTNYLTERVLLGYLHQIEVIQTKIVRERAERLLELQRDIHAALRVGVDEEDLEGISELVDEALTDLNSNLYKIGSPE